MPRRADAVDEKKGRAFALDGEGGTDRRRHDLLVRVFVGHQFAGSSPVFLVDIGDDDRNALRLAPAGPQEPIRQLFDHRPLLIAACAP